MTDYMIDLETLGTKVDAPVLSIGAVEFNLETGKLGQEFYCVLDLQSQLDRRSQINPIAP